MTHPPQNRKVTTTEKLNHLVSVLAIAAAAVGIGGLLPLAFGMAGMATPLFPLGNGVFFLAMLGGATATPRIGPSWDGNQTFQTMVLGVIHIASGHRGTRTFLGASRARASTQLDCDEPCRRAGYVGTSVHVAVGRRGGCMDGSSIGFSLDTNSSRVPIACLSRNSRAVVASMVVRLHPGPYDWYRGLHA